MDASAAPNGGKNAACTFRKTGVDCDNCPVRGISVCSALHADERAQLEGIAQGTGFDAKETIFLEGDRTSSFFNIISGAVRLFRLFRNGRRQVLGFRLPGDFLGLDMGDRHVFSAEAVEPTTVCRFGMSQFVSLVEGKPRLLRKLHERTGLEVGFAHDHMMALGHRSARERIAWFLLSLRDRQSNVGSAPDVVKLPMPRQDIADFLGLTIETVSRTLTVLARENIITISPRTVRFVDERQLTKLTVS
jgi:CRP/FNR family transcriptional regulator